MMWKGSFLGAVGKTHSILVFAHNTVGIEVKPLLEVIL